MILYSWFDLSVVSDNALDCISHATIELKLKKKHNIKQNNTVKYILDYTQK